MSFQNLHLNFWAILVAGGAYYVLGAVWYGVFGTTWLRLIGKSVEEIKRNASAAPYVIAALTSLVTAAVLACLLRLTQSDTSPLAAIQLGVMLWLGLSVGVAAKHYAFSGWPAKLLLLDYAYDLVAMLGMCAILAMWK